MNRQRRWLRSWFWILLAVGAGVSSRAVAVAQDGAYGEQATPSGGSITARAARLSFVQGSVTVENADGTGSQEGGRNVPLLTGTSISTAANGEAEIEFEDGSVVRLTPNSALSLDALSSDGSGVFTTNISLLRGLAYAELRATDQYRYALSAGGDVLSPVENATVRINADEPPAVFAVIDGAANVSPVSGAGTPEEVRSGESLRAGPDGEYVVNDGIADDTWDAWNIDRDEAAAAEAANSTPVRGDYAGAQGYGWSDLDANGTWYDVPGQGNVWQPSAAQDANFDPYGVGSWMWYPATGYVWASGYAWGWTPFRCGNWSYFGGFGWGWAPQGCGAAGWNFLPAGGAVNIAYGPGGYRVPHVPRPRPGPIHPIVPTRMDPLVASTALAGQTGWGTILHRGPREINGVQVTPVQRGGGAVSMESSRGHSALARDFPIEQGSHTALVGKRPSQPAVVRSDSGWRRANDGDTYTGQSGAAIYQNAPAMSQARGAAESRQASRPVYTGAQGARGAFPQGPAPQGPAYSPAQGMERRGYESGRPASQPQYTPAPQMQRPSSGPQQAPPAHAAPARPAASPGGARPSGK